MRKSLRNVSHDAVVTEYKIANWIYVVIVISMICGLAMIAIGIPSTPNSGGEIVLSIMGGAWFLMSLYLLFSAPRNRIVLEGEKITVCSPKEKSVFYRNVKSVDVINFHIVIDEGRVPKFIIPLIYEKPALLIASIERKVASARAGEGNFKGLGKF